MYKYSLKKMKKGYIGIDIGSISTKGVVVDEQNHIIASDYLWTEGDPMNAVKRLLKSLEKQILAEQKKLKLYKVFVSASVVNVSIAISSDGSSTPELEDMLQIYDILEIIE